MQAVQQRDMEAEDKWTRFEYGIQGLMDAPEYAGAIEEMLRSNKRRLGLNLDTLRKSNPELIADIFNNPVKSLDVCEKVLGNKALDLQGGSLGAGKKKQTGNVMQKTPEYHVTFEGNYGRFLVTPRGLHSTLINKLVAVQGIVTRISIVRPKLQHSVHYCDETKIGTVKEYYDQYTLNASETNVARSNAYPTKDHEGRPLSTEYGFCQYKDIQTLVIQEMPEKAPTGLLPRSVEVVLEDDLVDKIKPGDRVQIAGVYKCVASSSAMQNAVFKTIFVATGVQLLNNDSGDIQATPEDMKNIKTVSQRQDVFDLFARSFAPSIQGHDKVKRAVVLMLLGGMERNLENGTHLRGDINLLMIGDPSTAKSQLLRHVMNLAPLSIHTTGRGSSGVGLTAAVTYDRDTGERHLEAGAMVLADRGIVCVDEFDKMNEGDRVAIHEVMEQQTVTIAKAGIHTSLNARCSVIAAANPIYGEYQRDLPPTRNIGLPDSLLSRFDLIFIVLDEKDPEIDRSIAEKVTKNHRFVNPNIPNEGADFLSRLAADDDDAYVIEPEIGDPSDSTQVFEKLVGGGGENTNLLCQRFLKKYILVAKKMMKPQLNDESIEYITQVWTKLRQTEAEATQISAFRVMPLTTRTFETIIRLATAHAKLRLSQVIEKVDCEQAVKLLNFALFGDKDETDGNNDHAGDDGHDGPSGRAPAGGRSAHKREKREGMEEEMRRDEPRRGAGTGRSSQKVTKHSDSPSKALDKLALDESKKKKIKVTADDREEENADVVLERNIVGSIKVTAENSKYLFKNLVELFNTSKRQVISYEDLWNYLSTKQSGAEGSDIDNKEKMVKVLIELENHNKIMINPTAEAIYLL